MIVCKADGAGVEKLASFLSELALCRRVIEAAADRLAVRAGVVLLGLGNEGRDVALLLLAAPLVLA